MKTDLFINKRIEEFIKFSIQTERHLGLAKKYTNHQNFMRKRINKFQPQQKKTQKSAITVFEQSELEAILKDSYRKLTYITLISDTAEGLAADVVGNFKRIGIYNNTIKQKVNKLISLSMELRGDLTKNFNVEDDAIFVEQAEMLKSQFDILVHSIIKD